MSEPVLIAIIVAVPPTLAVGVAAYLGRKQLKEIHVLVNSRLTKALAEIAKLKKELRQRDRGSHDGT